MSGILFFTKDDFDAGYLYKCRLGDPPLPTQEVEKQKEQNAKGKSEASAPVEGASTKSPSLEDADTLEKRIPPTEPVRAARVDREKTITYWRFSKSGNRVLIGTKDGTIRVQLLERPFDFTSFKGYWNFRIHDETRGAVNCIALSHDEK